MDEPYQVEYQIFGVIHFEHDRLMSGSDLANSWKETEIFQQIRKRAYGNFYRLGNVNPHATRSVPIGSLEVLSALLGENDMPIFGGASYGQKYQRFEDQDFFFCHDP